MHKLCKLGHVAHMPSAYVMQSYAFIWGHLGKGTMKANMLVEICEKQGESELDRNMDNMK